MMMDIRPIRTREDFEWALAERSSPYFENEPEPRAPRSPIASTCWPI